MPGYCHCRELEVVLELSAVSPLRDGSTAGRGQILNRLGEQTVVVAGTGILDLVIPSLAAVHEQRRAVETQISTLLEAHSLS